MSAGRALPADPPATGWRGYLGFLGIATAVTLVLGLAGWVPTRRLAGEAATASLVAGCAVSLAASALGGLLLAREEARAGGRGSGEPRRDAAPPVFAALGATVLRLGVTLVLGGALAFAGVVPRVPLLAWLAVSYGALLAVDTRYAVAVARAGEEAAPRTTAGTGRDEREPSLEE